MKIAESSLKDLQEIGVYKITNLCNSKVYIGSTRKSFVSRYASHYEKLRTNNHKGYWHLQNAVNKYGIEAFEFEILEICDKEICIQRETYWISKYSSCNREKGYNTIENPTLSPFANKEIRMKAAKTLIEGYETGRLTPNKTTFKSGLVPWNKGKQYQSTDHLKVPKKRKANREKFMKTVKDKQQPIDVFDSKGLLLGSYRYYQDIQKDESLHKHMLLRNNKGRNGYSPHYLTAFNIQKSCKTGKSYKGLIFKTISSPKIPLNGESL